MDVEVFRFFSEGVPVDSKEVSRCGLNVVVASQSPFDYDLLHQVDDVWEEGTS